MDELIKFPTSIIAKEKGFKLFKDNELGYASNELVFDPDGTLCRLSYECNPLVDNKKWFELRKVNSSDRNDPKNIRIFPIKTNFEPAGIKTYLVPTQTALHKWLREIYKYNIFCTTNYDDKWIYQICEFSHGNKTTMSFESFSSYEEAFEAGLLKVLKLIPVSIGKNYKFMIDADEYSGKVIDIQGNTVSVAVFNGIIHNIPITELS